MPRYYAYVTRFEGDPDGESLLYFDAVPRETVLKFARQLGRGVPLERVAEAVQNEMLKEIEGENWVVRLAFGDGEDLPSSRKLILQGLRPSRWYGITLGKAGEEDAQVDCQAWPAKDLLAEATRLTVSQVYTVRGDLRNRLDVLFTLRGSSPGGGGKSLPSKGPVNNPQWRKVFSRHPHDPHSVYLGPDGLGATSHAFSKNDGLTRRYVGVWNVGQGACAALYDSNLRPIVFFDFGFPTMPNVKSAPWNLNYIYKNSIPPATVAGLPLKEIALARPCLCRSPLIVLSHGDYDHWYMIELMLNEINGNSAVKVLAPANVAGASMHGTWKNVSNREVMPDGETWEYPWGFLVRCTGSRKKTNPSGIAAFVRVRDGGTRSSLAPSYPLRRLSPPIFFSDEEYVLLPGDAPYSHIPGIDDTSLKLVGLIASHHGANVAGMSKLPNPAVPLSPIVYSYGLRTAGAHGWQPSPSAYLGNAAFPPVYTDRCEVHAGNEGHPRKMAVANYQAKGWVFRLNTAYETSSCPNPQHGNWLLGPSDEFACGSVVVCSSLACPENAGSRGSRFRRV